MEEPDFSKAFARRVVAMNYQNKYTAVCFLYDGIEHQNLCKFKNPDGTYNFSQNCLAKLPPMPMDTSLAPFIGAYRHLNSSSSSSASTSSPTEQGLVKYDDRQQTPMPPFNAFVLHYWLPIFIGALIICLTTLLLVNFITPLFRKKNKGPKMARVDESGNISLGKISFYPDDVLGMGSKGTFVYRGCFEKSQDCAVKRVVSQCLTLADREVDFLRSLQHPNLVRYLATEVDPQFIYIALELAEYTLRSVIEGKKLAEVCLSREEICRQAATGLHHLHQLNIVHRDIKPENILISFPKRPKDERKVMISDFGLSKELSNFETGHSSSVMRYFDGTQGWMAPEIIDAKVNGNNLAPSKAADIFSLGCVFYFIVFDGQHPYGDAVESRQFNIISNKNVLNDFRLSQTDKNNDIRKELVVMCNNLVRAMLEPNPADRPPISSVLKFPMFWAKKEQLHFLSEVSDRLDKDKDVVSRVERNRQRIFGFDWKQSLGKSLLDDIEGPGTKHRSYSERKLQDLLRVIRNKKNHYNECSEELKVDLGELPDQFLDYFNTRFPELIVHVYKAIQVYKQEKKFRDYYEQDDDYVFN